MKAYTGATGNVSGIGKRQFKRSRTSTSNKPYSGRPKTATNNEMVDKIHDVVLADRRLNLKAIAKTTDVCCRMKRAMNALALSYPKFWVWKSFWCDGYRVCTYQSKNEIGCPYRSSVRIQRTRSDFFMYFVIVDEAWIDHYIPETNEYSKQWTTGE